MVRFSHHAVNFGPKALPDHYNKKWFGVKTGYFLVRKRDISFFSTWCENVNIWCEFETFAVH